MFQRIIQQKIVKYDPAERIYLMQRSYSPLTKILCQFKPGATNILAAYMIILPNPKEKHILKLFLKEKIQQRVRIVHALDERLGI